MCIPWAGVRSYSLSTNSGDNFGDKLLDLALLDPSDDTGCQGSMMRARDDVAAGKPTIYFTNPHNGTLRVDMSLHASVDDAGWHSERVFVPGVSSRV